MGSIDTDEKELISNYLVSWLDGDFERSTVINGFKGMANIPNEATAWADFEECLNVVLDRTARGEITHGWAVTVLQWIIQAA